MSKNSFESERTSEQAKKNRKEAGAFLKKLRQDARYTQKELAEKLGFSYYTFISQLESGNARLPADYFGVVAQTMGLSPSRFTLYMVKLYDPTLFHWLTYQRPEDANVSQDEFVL